MNSKSTTDLETIRKEPGKFTWGAIISIEDLGRYTFVKFIWSDNSTQYHIYVDGKDISRGASDLEYAMLLAISFGKLENPNHAGWMARAAIKLFQKDPE